MEKVQSVTIQIIQTIPRVNVYGESFLVAVFLVQQPAFQQLFNVFLQQPLAHRLAVVPLQAHHQALLQVVTQHYHLELLLSI